MQLEAGIFFQMRPAEIPGSMMTRSFEWNLISAMTSLQQDIRKDPGDAQAWAALARVLGLCGLWDAADESLEYAALLCPADYLPWLHFYVVLERRLTIKKYTPSQVQQVLEGLEVGSRCANLEPGHPGESYIRSGLERLREKRY